MPDQIVDNCIEGPSTNSRGYSTIKIDGKTYQRHRTTWELFYGPIPEGMYICHHCDNKKCCNIKHLFLGTQQDNVDDYNSKGLRNVKGTRNSSAKITEEDVVEIRRLYSKGLTQANIGFMFGIRQGHISRIVRGENWSHL